MKNKAKKQLNIDETSVKPTQSTDADMQVEAVLDELALIPVKKRVWEIDFLRGLMILFVVWDHFMWDINTFKPYQTDFFNWLYALSQTYYSAMGIRRIAQPVFVTMFVFTSGVSCSFSHSNGRRAIKMVIFACLLTAGTYALSSIVGANFKMNFNVIHVIALSTLLWAFIEFCRSKCKSDWQKNIFGVVMAIVTITAIVVGGYADFKPWTNDNPMWFFLAKHSSNTAYREFCGADYLPFLPDFGWFLVGAFLGGIVYKEKTSIFPSVNSKFVCPITFCGRHSLWVYFGSQIVMFGLVYLLSVILGCI